jgi:hypothetical protein
LLCTFLLSSLRAVPKCILDCPAGNFFPTGKVTVYKYFNLNDLAVVEAGPTTPFSSEVEGRHCCEALLSELWRE